MNQSGFTLIEMLVVLVIMAAIASLSVASFRDFATGKSLDLTAQEIVSFLQQAKSNSTAIRDPFCIDPPGISFEAWIVEITPTLLQFERGCLYNYSGCPQPIVGHLKEDMVRRLYGGTCFQPISYHNKFSLPQDVRIRPPLPSDLCFLPLSGKPVSYGTSLSIDPVWGVLSSLEQYCLDVRVPPMTTPLELTITHTPTGKQKKVCVTPVGRIYSTEVGQTCQ